MLYIEGLTIGYGDKNVIHGATLRFGEGINTIIGQRGSGKSSILNAIAGQIPSQMTSFIYGEEDLNAYGTQQFQQFVLSNVTYLVQGDNFISDLICFENIAFFAKMVGKVIQPDEIKELLKTVGLDLEPTVYTDRLSGGKKQRLAIAQALAKDTPIILCDEITSSLDELNKKEVMNILQILSRKYHKIIIMISHDEDVYERSDSLYQIEDGYVHEIKSSNDASVQKLNSTAPMLRARDFKQYVSAKMNRQFGMFLMFALICGFIIVLCTYITHYRSSFMSQQREIIEVLSPKEINIINQTVSNMFSQTSTFMYDKENKPFDKMELEQIIKTPHVQEAYPYYQCASTNHALDGVYIESLTIGSNTYEYYAEEAFNVFLYNPSQNFNEVHQVIKESDSTGAYVNEMFIMNCLKMTKEEFMALEDKTMTFDCYVPVANTQEESYALLGDDTEEIAFTSYTPVYQPKRVKIEIVGIIDPWYQETMGYQNIYLPIDLLESMRLEATKEYELKENE